MGIFTHALIWILEVLQKNLTVLLIAWPPSDKGSGKNSDPQ